MTLFIVSFQEIGCPLCAQAKLPLLWGCWWNWAVPGARKIKARVTNIRSRSTGLLYYRIHAVWWLLSLTARPRTSPQPTPPVINLIPRNSKMNSWWLHPLGYSKDSSNGDQGWACDPRKCQSESLPGVFLAGNTKKNCEFRAPCGHVFKPMEKSVCIKEWGQTGMTETVTEEKRTERNWLPSFEYLRPTPVLYG